MKSNLMAQLIAFFSMLLGANMMISVWGYAQEYTAVTYINLVIAVIMIFSGLMVLIKSRDKDKKEMPYIILLAVLFLATQIVSILRALRETFGSGLFILYFELFLAAPTILVIVYFIKARNEIKYRKDHPVEESPSFTDALERIKDTNKKAD